MNCLFDYRGVELRIQLVVGVSDAGAILPEYVGVVIVVVMVASEMLLELHDLEVDAEHLRFAC